MQNARKLAVLLSLGIGVGMTVLADDAHAQSARHTSLANNQLILDRTDVLTFPQLSVDYTNLLALDYGAVAPSGSGLVLLGNNQFTFGLGIAQGNILGDSTSSAINTHPNLGAPANLLGAPYPAVHTIVDLFFGMDVGGGLFGARLGIGHGGNSTTPTIASGRDDDSNSQTFVRGDVGYSLRGDFRLDTALRLVYNFGDNTINGNSTRDASQFQVGLAGRAYTPLAAGIDLGLLADIQYTTTGETSYFPSPAPNIDSGANTFSLLAGAGPVYTIDGVTTLAGYGVIGFVTDSNDPNKDANDDAVSSYGLVLPGVAVAADIHLTDWLYFRTGAQYLFILNSTTREQAPNDDTINRNRTSNFGWSAGLGLKVGNFALDGTLQHGFLTAGPNFLGGGAPGLFSMVSASYAF